MTEANGLPPDISGPLVDLLKVDSLSELSVNRMSAATMSVVWRVRHPKGADNDVAVRLTRKPRLLIERISALVDSVGSVPCPRTLAVGTASFERQDWTFQICTWLPHRHDEAIPPFDAGRAIALLHEDLAVCTADFSDRPLSFDLTDVTPSDPRPAWRRVRDVWGDYFECWQSVHESGKGSQILHGDMHWGNIVMTSTGPGFIDFDKMMVGPAVFDVAKLITTGMFRTDGTGTAVYLRWDAHRLVEGYQSVRELSTEALTAATGVCVLVNEATGMLGETHGRRALTQTADAVGEWWLEQSKTDSEDPLGIIGLARG